VFTFLLVVQLYSKSIYVANTGNDSNTGTKESPFLTIGKGINSMSAGDTVFIRGGIFSISTSITFAKVGSDTIKYFLFAYPGERPLLDFTAQTSSDGLKVNGKYLYVYGIEVQNSAHNGIAVNGSYNIIENCIVHDNRNTGLQLGNGASYNKIINCDSYYNFDPPLGGNADGFSPKLDVGTGNYFYGCRSWQNSDDGWDGYMRPSDNVTTTLENCWTFMNGYLKNGNPITTGNGNGFKMGGGDNSNRDTLRHNMILKNCISFDNRVKGFDQNNNRGSMTLLNCTGYRNGAENYKISAFIRVSESLSVKNCLEFGNKVSLATFAVQQTNSWTIPLTVSEADFVSLDTTGIRDPRKADGSLPDIKFLHLAAGSKLINAGTNIGLPFSGSAPDLGAFEFDSPELVKDKGIVISEFRLHQNYPNPFNPSTVINYQLPMNSCVTLKVYDAIGREVITLVNEVKETGYYTATFNASQLTSGIYFYQLRAGTFVETRKMMIVK
jgi:hypothetical protein